MPTIKHLLPQQGVLTRPVRTMVNGQVVEVRAAMGSLACRISGPARGSLSLYGLAENAERARVAYFELGADVRANDRLEVNGCDYRVVDVETQPDGAYTLASLERLA